MLLPFILSGLTQISGTSVAGGSGSAQRLQQAIDDCPTTGCSIELPDAKYPLAAQIWIEAKRDIRLIGTGATPPVLCWEDSLLGVDANNIAKLFHLKPPAGGNRTSLPANWLRWPLTAKGGLGSAADLTNPISTTGFQHNGLFLVKKSQRIQFRNLILDGVKSAVFVNPAVWQGQFDIFHGSVGINLFQSQAVEIAQCELRHFWSAFYINNRNPDCMDWREPTDLTAAAKPWSQCGTMGNHLIERNRIHDNWWGVYNESEWDMGSVFRENLAWANQNQALRAPSTCVAQKLWDLSTDIGTQGGFMYVKDVLLSAHVVSHNTIYDGYTPYFSSSFKATGNALWSDNILDLSDSLTAASWLDLFTRPTNHLWNSTALHTSKAITTTNLTATFQDASILYTKLVGVPVDTLVEVVKGVTVTRIMYDSVPTPVDCSTGCTIPVVPTPVITGWQTPPWSAQALGGGYWTARAPAADASLHNFRTWDPSLVDSASLLLFSRQDTLDARLRDNWLCRPKPFVSRVSTNAKFLLPDTNSQWAKTSLLPNGSRSGRRGALGPDGRLGSHVPVRLRATGIPHFDPNVGLVLPLSVHSDSTALDRIAVRRIRIVSLWIDTTGKGIPPRQLAHPVALPPAFAATDTALVIPWSSARDSIYQIDAWFAGVAGTDSLEATPLSWIWVPRSNQTQSVRHYRPAPERVKLLHAGSPLLLVTGGEPVAKVQLSDIQGKTLELATVPSADGYEIPLAGLHGTWFAVLPGRTVPLLLNP